MDSVVMPTVCQQNSYGNHPRKSNDLGAWAISYLSEDRQHARQSPAIELGICVITISVLPQARAWYQAIQDTQGKSNAPWASVTTGKNGYFELLGFCPKNIHSLNMSTLSVPGTTWDPRTQNKDDSISALRCSEHSRARQVSESPLVVNAVREDERVMET